MKKLLVIMMLVMSTTICLADMRDTVQVKALVEVMISVEVQEAMENQRLSGVRSFGNNGTGDLEFQYILELEGDSERNQFCLLVTVETGKVLKVTNISKWVDGSRLCHNL